MCYYEIRQVGIPCLKHLMSNHISLEFNFMTHTIALMHSITGESFISL